MVHIIPCQDRFEELVRFVARLNSDGTHHIGFFGEGEADIRSSLAECLIPPEEGFLLAYDEERLAGVFGVDVNPEIGRAWLFGPLVDHADWHALADTLYAGVVSLIPADIRDRDLFCDEQNVRMHEFGMRHGFELRSKNAIMSLARDQYTPNAKRKTKIIAYQPGFFDAFEKLHDTLFPKTYFTARQIVEKLDGAHQLLLAVEENSLLGYNFCKIDREAESGYVDFIGTDESARRGGIGADLLASGVDWMLSAVSTRRINLTVNADNLPARSLYEKFGFITERIMRGYRKHVD